MRRAQDALEKIAIAPGERVVVVRRAGEKEDDDKQRIQNEQFSLVAVLPPPQSTDRRPIALSLL